MTARAAVPVVVGVGEVTQRPGDGDGSPLDPLALAAEAARRAADDAGGTARLLAEVDSVDVVNIVGWSYADPAAQLGAAVGAAPRRAEHSAVGGHQPTALLDAAAARIAAGDSAVALVAGGEAMRSLELAMRAGGLPPWPGPPPDARPVDPRDHASERMVGLDLLLPTDVYPLYEHPSRRAAGATQAEARRESARQWARASEVAAGNPSAWVRQPVPAEQIATVSEGNRVVAWPYPKLLNAQLGVDQAAAVLVASEDAARRLGIPEDRWVHPWGGAGAAERRDVLSRSTFERTVAGAAALDGALEVAGVAVDEVDLVELYSCFPCVPRMAAAHLGLGADRGTTVTGGLTFFGGPGNDYMLHAVAAMTRALRAGAGRLGLLYGQGGYATTHHALVLGRDRPPAGYGADDADDPTARQAAVDAQRRPRFTDGYQGEGSVETFTIPYGRDGQPARVVLVGRSAAGERFAGEVALEAVGAVAAVLTAPDEEPLGRPVRATTGVDGRTTVELLA